MKPLSSLRIFGLVALLGLVWIIAHSKLASSPLPYGQKPVITLVPIAFSPKDYQASKDMRLDNVYELKTKGTDQLVGLSDLIYKKNGIGLLSDQGIWFQAEPKARLTYNITKQSYLVDQLGRDWSDVEDVAFDHASGDYYFSYEREHRLEVYDMDFQKLNSFRPSVLSGLEGNRGIEGLGIGLNDEKKIVMVIASETGDFFICNEFSKVRIDKCQSLKPPASIPENFRPVSLEALENGDGWLILYRAFDLFSGLRTLLVHSHLGKDVWRDQKILLRIEKGAIRDNYEGVSAFKTARGYEIALISDPLVSSGAPRLMILSLKNHNS